MACLDGAASISIPASSQMKLHALVEPVAERPDAEVPVGADVGREDVDVVEPLDRAATTGVTTRHVLQRRRQIWRRIVAIALVVELEQVAVGIGETVTGPAPTVPVGPPDSEPRRLDHRHAPRECLGIARPQPEHAHPRRVTRGQLERPRLIVAPPAQVARRPLPMLNLHAHDMDEESEAFLALGGEHLDRAEVRKIVHDACSTTARRPSSS
jgi:hypothetical protein